MGYAEGSKKLPPLPENYFGTQIDEVSSARDSVIENESRIEHYKERVKKQQETMLKLSRPKFPLTTTNKGAQDMNLNKLG